MRARGTARRRPNAELSVSDNSVNGSVVVAPAAEPQEGAQRPALPVGVEPVGSDEIGPFWLQCNVCHGWLPACNRCPWCRGIGFSVVR